MLGRAAIAILFGCALAGPSSGADHQVGSLRLIAEQKIPFAFVFENTPVGGLSGIDYEPGSGTWILISDDRSAKAPARFYIARMPISVDKVEPLVIEKVVTLTKPGGQPFPAAGGEVPDPEAIRFDPTNGALWWASEGSRKLGLSPSLRQATLEGRSDPPLPTPPAFAARNDEERGSRENLAFEGLSLSADLATLWVSMEAPIYQDGPVPTPDAGAVTRFTHLDRKGVVLAEYAYPLDPIPARPGHGKAADNGVTEILAVDAGRLLVVERAGVQAASGDYSTFVRIYEASLAGATDVNGLPALAGASYSPMAKRLVLDLNTLGLAKLDNIEGMAWGPPLGNGHETLVLVSDDNFNALQVTQLLVFEVVP